MSVDAGNEKDNHDKQAIQDFRQSLAQFSYSSSSSLTPRRSSRVAKVAEGPLPSPPQTIGKKRSQGVHSSSPSPKKAKRGYAPPETYAHLDALHDYLRDGLDVMFCGINPGYMSAEKGHHFANPTNHFWKCLHLSGLTPRLLPPSEDFTLPEKYNLGLTNLVSRPSAEAGELSALEMASGAPVLLGKVIKHRPRIVCFVGKAIWLTVQKFLSNLAANGPEDPQTSSEKQKSSRSSPAKSKKKAADFTFGLQPYKIICEASGETLFYAVPSTSGRVTSHQLPDKAELFKGLRLRLQGLKESTLDTSHMSTIVVAKLPSEPTHGRN